IRLVVEEGLNQLPYTECTVTTPTGHKYEGVRFEKGNCGVSIMRSAEVPPPGDQGFLQFRHAEVIVFQQERTVPSFSHTPVLARIFPGGLGQVLQPGGGKKTNIKISLFPLSGTGNTVIEAVKVLVEHGVQPSVIILLSLFSTPHGAKSIIQEFPEITILTTEVHPVAPTHFGQKYFGTD
ncbi:UPP phosphoribosyltransferase, partial [Chunga burmeisteri]|nr:UPP phosphoribosyltransferase [Chunga burmeisteri]